MEGLGFGLPEPNPLAGGLVDEFVGFLESKISERITKFIKSLAYHYREEPFTLSSGSKSNHYVDMKKVLFDPRVLDLTTHWMLSKILYSKVLLVGGTEMGAAPIVTACISTAYASKVPLGGFVVRKDIKNHGTQNLVEGPKAVPGMKCAIVDDVLTTGASLLHAITAAKGEGLDVVKVVVVLDREEGGRENLLAAGYAVEAITTLRKVIEADIGPESSGDKAVNNR